MVEKLLLPKLENLDLGKLNFEQLKKTYEEVNKLAAISFSQTENGFRNVRGDVIWISETEEGVFELRDVSSSLRDIHRLLATENSVLNKGSKDKAEIMQAMREVLEKFGNRIIE